MRCQLCGYEFDETKLHCHTSCPLNTYCAIICCPNCGYQTTDESKSRLISGLRNLLKTKIGGAARTSSASTMSEEVSTPCPLSQLRSGQTAQLIAIDTQHANRLERLQIYGLIPGATLTLMQRRPEFVVLIGHTELAIERKIADQIMVVSVTDNGVFHAETPRPS